MRSSSGAFMRFHSDYQRTEAIVVGQLLVVEKLNSSFYAVWRLDAPHQYQFMVLLANFDLTLLSLENEHFTG